QRSNRLPHRRCYEPAGHSVRVKELRDDQVHGEEASAPSRRRSGGGAAALKRPKRRLRGIWSEACKGEAYSRSSAPVLRAFEVRDRGGGSRARQRAGAPASRRIRHRRAPLEDRSPCSLPGFQVSNGKSRKREGGPPRRRNLDDHPEPLLLVSDGLWNAG